MTLSSRVARLDDASGELALSLSKLQLEAARGALNRDEQIDFLHDLHRAAYRREIRPWRGRALQVAAAGLVCLGAAALLPPELAHRGELQAALAALAGISLLGAAACLGVFLRRLRRERQWFREQERAVLEGHPLVQAPGL